MSTSNVHQQSLADVGSETRPPMLERGSYIPRASHFRRYLNRKKETRKWLNKAIDEGPYEFRIFTPSETEAPRLQKEEDLRGDDLKHYEADIEAMNLILISILNDIYDSVDRETRFNNEFDQFVAEPGEALVLVYNRFAQLMNDLERNHIIFPKVTINTKFLNCLQPEWLKYVTQARLAKRLTEDSYDDLFDYLLQFKKLVNASRAKKLEKSHDPLALVAHTGSSSRTSSPYYVTHPFSVVDYDDDYQGDTVQNNFDDPLTSAMILLARDMVNIQSKNSGNDGRNTRHSYVQEEVIKSNNVQNDAGNIQRTLRTASLGTVANVQCYNCSERGHYARNYPKPIIRDSKYFMEQMLLAKEDEAGVILTDEQNDFLFADASRMEEIEELSANICLMARIQPANIDSDAGPSYNSAFLSEVQTPSTSYENPLFAKDYQEQKYPTQPKIINKSIGDDQIDSNIIFDEPNEDVNSGNVENDNNVQDSYELEQLARNAYKEAEKQQIIAKKVQQQNIMLTKQLKLYKEKADRKAKRFEQESQSQFIRDRDIIRDLEQQRDKLYLNVVELKKQTVELQKTQSILKHKMSENKDQYHDTVLNLEAKVKKNVDTMLKIGNSLQGMFMLGPKPMSFNDSKLKHGLRYANPYTHKKTISQNPKLYDASCLDDSKIHMNIRDTEDILEDATKSQIKMKNKMKDPIAIGKKQNVSTIDYNKYNMQDEIEKVQRGSIEIQEGMQKRINILKNDVQRCQKQKRENVKTEYQKLFDLIKKTSAQTQGEINELFENVKQRTYAYADVRAQNQDLLLTISELKAKLKTVKNGLSTTSSVRRPSNRDSSFKNNVVSNTKNSSKKVEVSDRTNKKLDVASKMWVKCLGHNLFSVGQFCDGDFKVAFRSKTCYVHNLEGDDLLTGDRESNLYTISIPDMTSSSPVCLMSKASSTKSWLWHRRLSGKSKKASHPPKLVPSSHSKLELLHMDLCGPMRVASINRKKYILVIVDDYSRFTWVYFLHSKYETPEIIKKFIAQVQLNYDAKIHKIRTHNSTEFKNDTLKAHYEKLGIMQQFLTARTPQKNSVVERRNRTLVKATRIMLSFS
ncbi:integrase, catalytic region, zinc finger, CCHC-type containing protein [Tanacetum coccineum]